jgi:capsule biosynthesis phosphatase
MCRMKRIVVDLDGTLTIDDPKIPYALKEPNQQLVATLRAYKADGFSIAVATARNMKTHDGNLGKINKLTLPVIIDWLEKNDVPYDEVYVGKPWCGDQGFYVDDRAVRPSEFTSLTYAEIVRLLRMEPDS